MSVEEGQKIWANFAKFAIYDDLRDLYHRCVPAISAFEDKLQDVRNELKQFEYVIKDFDGKICDKASKETVKKFTTYADNTYIQKAENEEFLDNIKEQFEDFSKKIVYLEDILKSQTKAMQKEMFNAVRKVVG